MEKIDPMDQRAIDYFENQLEINVPDNLNIEKSINFYVNDVSVRGDKIFKIIY